MPDIVHRVGINASPFQVFEALTTQEGLASWWTRQTTAEPKLGAVLQFRFGGGGPDMEVVELDPPRLIRWKCLSGPSEWIEVDGETVVLFAHRKWHHESEFMAHCSAKWGYFFLGLKSLVEDGRGHPFPDDAKVSRWG